jgi:hypothetical protein
MHQMPMQGEIAQKCLHLIISQFKFFTQDGNINCEKKRCSRASCQNQKGNAGGGGGGNGKKAPLDDDCCQCRARRHQAGHRRKQKQQQQQNASKS